MCKTDKKLLNNKKIDKNLEKKNGLSKPIISDCFVKLVKLNKEQILKWNKQNNNKKEETAQATFNVDIKIRKNVLSIEQNAISVKPNENINIGLSIHLQDVIVECCTVERPIKMSNPKTLTQIIEEMWRKCKQTQSGFQIAENQIVLAKMKSYPPWPSTVEKITANKKRLYVYFFGAHNRGYVDLQDAVRFEAANDVIRLLLKRPEDRNMKYFRKGILEAELIMGIDIDNSITKEQGAIN